MILATDGAKTLYLIEPNLTAFKPIATAGLLAELKNDDPRVAGFGTQNLIVVYVNADIPVHHIRKKLNKAVPPDQMKKFNYFNLISDTMAAMTNQMASTIIKNTPSDILVEISKKSFGTYDFYKAEELVEIGRYAAREKLELLINDCNS